MDQHYNDFCYNAEKATGQGRICLLPRYQANLKYSFDGLHNYRTKIAHLDLLARVLVKFGTRSPTSTTQYNYTRRLLEDNYGFQELNEVSK